jgi:CelD/BcsL family acetyltransferase involved in cellulose biosynthesis
MSFHFSGSSTSQSGTTASALPTHIEQLLAGAPDIGNTHTAMQLIRTRAEFEALEVEWNTLFERAARPEQMFQSFNWLWHWAQHFTTPDRADFAIVTMRRGGTLVGVLPLVVERAFGLRQLAFMGAPVSQYGDALLVEDDFAANTVEGALRFAIASTRPDVVRFAKVRDGSSIAAALPRFGASLTAAEEAPYIDLTRYATFAAYQARFSNKARKNRRRLERRLEELGAIDAQWDIAGQAGSDAAAATLVLKRAWLKSRGQLSRAFADPRTDAFFADVCAGQMRSAGASVSLLRSGGEIANAAISVNAKGRQALHILAYGRKFEKCAPGVLHVEKLIEQAFGQGLRIFDFLAPRHEYKNEWADGTVRVTDYAVPVTVLGRLYTRAYLGFARERGKAAVKAAAGHLRGPLSFVQSAARRLGA